MESKTNITDRLLRYVRENSGSDATSDSLTPESDLFEDGYIDSRDFERFIAWMEETFTVSIDDQYLFDERIASISGLTDIVIEILTHNNG